MERLKKGLERARRERERQAAHVLMTERGSGRPAARPHENRIVYVHTRRLDTTADHLRRHRVISSLADPNAAMYSLLRTKVAQSMDENGWQSLAITSPNEGAGKTVTSINLAISLARDVNRSVLLVDLDLRQPRLHSYFTDQALPGLSDFLTSDIPVHSLLVNPGIERLVLLPGNQPVQHAAEMLSAPKMAELVEELKNRYPERLVLFDMPPVLLCDDVLAFSPYFEAALLVVEEGVTSPEQLQQALSLLGRTNVIGTVMNKSRTTKEPSTYYGYAH